MIIRRPPPPPPPVQEPSPAPTHAREPFNINNWYWIVGGDETRVWSSARSNYFPVDNATYVDWLTDTRKPTRIASETELSTVLLDAGLQGPVILKEQVNAERDRRVAIGFTFNGHLFQSDVPAQKRINGAVMMAILALQSGVQPGDLHWHGGAEDFAWLSADNTLAPMDAHTVVEFGKVAGGWEAAHVFAGRAIKDMNPIPRDFADNKYWP